MKRLFVLVSVFGVFSVSGCEDYQHIELDVNLGIQRKMMDVRCKTQCSKDQVCTRVIILSSVIWWECQEVEKSKGLGYPCSTYIDKNRCIAHTCPSNLVCPYRSCEFKKHSRLKGRACRDYFDGEVEVASCKKGLVCMKRCIVHNVSYGQRCGKFMKCAKNLSCMRGRCLVHNFAHQSSGENCNIHEECVSRFCHHWKCTTRKILTHGQRCRYYLSGSNVRFLQFQCQKGLQCRLGDINVPDIGYFCLYPHYSRPDKKSCAFLVSAKGDPQKCGELNPHYFFHECGKDLYCDSGDTRDRQVLDSRFQAGVCVRKKKRGTLCYRDTECQSGRCLETDYGTAYCAYKRKKVRVGEVCYGHFECRGDNTACIFNKCAIVKQGYLFSRCSKKCQGGYVCVQLCDKQRRCVYQRKSRKVGELCRINEDCIGYHAGKVGCHPKTRRCKKF